MRSTNPDKVGVKRRFSSGDADAVEFAPAAFEKGEECLFGQLRRILPRGDELRVVAVWTCEVAADREHGCGQSAREVTER